jgi:hypothetical protein
MGVVKLLRVDGTRLSVVGLDCLDGTPLIDIKPYFASTDSVPEAVVGWNNEYAANSSLAKSFLPARGICLDDLTEPFEPLDHFPDRRREGRNRRGVSCPGPLLLPR